MKPGSRSADGRFIRELPDGTIDAVALGTIATGLVVGAADHLPSANARPADRHATLDVAPPPEPSGTHAEVPPPASGSAATGEAASHADGLSTAAALAQTLSADGDPSVAVPMPPADASHADTPQLHEALGAMANTISSAMQTLVDHVQANAGQPDHLSSVLQHVGAMADSAVAMVNGIAATPMATLPDPPSLPSVSATLDHVLNATLSEVPVVPSVTQTLDHVLDATLPEVPAVPSVMQTLNHVLDATLPEVPVVPSVTQTLDHVLDAPPLPELPAVPSVTQTLNHVLDAAPLLELPAIPPVTQALDHVLGAVSPPDLPASPADVPANVLGAVDSVVDHAAPPVVEAQPLPIGFLGQSYTEVHDPHDLGSHGLTSMLHGMI